MPYSPILESICKRIGDELQLFPVVATELEFYLHGAGAHKDIPAFLEELKYQSSMENLNIGEVEKERGDEQYEIALHPGTQPRVVVEDTKRLKTVIEKVSAGKGLRADFSAKPFADQPGSGLHVHVNLVDASGKNVFFKENDAYSDTLLHAIGGMLATLKEAMSFFAPTRKSYVRFVPGYNVPVTVSWGANNRTVAVRLPTKPAENKHVEHRVSGADADPGLVMCAVLAGVHYGIAQKIKPPEQIFGDAALPIYGLEPLPKELKTALNYLQSGTILPRYFGDAFCKNYVKSLLQAA